MDVSAVLSFPLPMVTALLCGVIAVLVWRLDLGLVRANAMFAAIFAMCAVESCLVGLRFGYGVETFVAVQRILPLFLGPLLYLGFAAMTVGPGDFRKARLIHLGAPVVIVVLFWALIGDLRRFDWLISASYLFYVVALFGLWRRGPDALIYVRVDVMRPLSNWIWDYSEFCALTW